MLLLLELHFLQKNAALHFDILFLAKLVEMHLLLPGLFLEAVGFVDDFLVLEENLLDL